MTSGRVTHAQTGGLHVLRYFGRVNYVLAPAIKQFADDLVSHGGVQAWIFDLTRAEILDSTNLGLLARLAVRAGGEGDSPPRSVIVSSSDDLDSVLRSMSFDELFEIVKPPPPPDSVGPGPGNGGGEESIDAGAPTRRELGETMLDAHRALIALSETSRAQFQDLVAALEADLAPD
jgi:anti-anti-sigma regulatory factor